MNEREIPVDSIMPALRQTVKKDAPKKIIVTVHLPENLRDSIRQQKINRIYDILKPDRSR